MGVRDLEAIEHDVERGVDRNTVCSQDQGKHSLDRINRHDAVRLEGLQECAMGPVVVCVFRYRTHYGRCVPRHCVPVYGRDTVFQLAFGVQGKETRPREGT